MIELPSHCRLQLPVFTTSLTSDKGLREAFANFGIKIAYTRIGITALILWGILSWWSGPFSRFWETGLFCEEARYGCKNHSPFSAGYSSELLPAMLSKAGLASTLPENTEALFLSQEMFLLYRDHAAGSCQSFRSLTMKVTAIALVTLGSNYLIPFGVNLVQARNTKRIRGEGW